MALLPNSIGWAQVRLVGGRKNLVVTLVAYTVVLGLVMFAGVRSTGVHSSTMRTFDLFMRLFLVLQVLTLLLFGSWRVGNAVRSDVRSRVIESHRLMPVPAMDAVLGYLFGAPLQALVVFVGNFLLGAVATAGAGLPMQSWVFSNLVLLAFSLFVWVIVLFFSFRSGLPILVVVAGMLAVAVSGLQVVLLSPGLTVLASPLIGRTIFDVSSSMAGDWQAYFIATVAQGCIGILFLIAAGRRYRSDEAIGFDAVLGLLLLAAWVGICIVGTEFRAAFRISPRFYHVDQDFQFIVSFAVALLLAVVPVASSARLIETPYRGKRHGGAAVLLTIVIATAICLALTYSRRLNLRPVSYSQVMRTVVPGSMSIRVPVRVEVVAYFGVTTTLVRTAIVIAAFLIGARYVLGIAYRLRVGPRRTMIAWLFVTWCLPIVAELSRPSWSVDSDFVRISQIALCSPLGEIYHLWSTDWRMHIPGFAGLATQCCLALGTAVAYYTVVRPRKSTVLPLPVPA